VNGTTPTVDAVEDMRLKEQEPSNIAQAIDPETSKKVGQQKKMPHEGSMPFM
jgi:hypothetical protein